MRRFSHLGASAAVFAMSGCTDLLGDLDSAHLADAGGLEDDGPPGSMGTDGGMADSAAADAPVACATECGASGHVVLFGGVNPNFPTPGFNDTWMFTGTAWAEIYPSSSPTGRVNASLATLGKEVVLFGGSVGGSPGYANDTWSFDGSAWTQIVIPTSPPSRAGASIATLGNGVFLFGGDDGPALRDLWQFDGTAWTSFFTGISMPARGYASMAPLAGKIVLFGGLVPNSSTLFNDTWTLDVTPQKWTQASLSNAPSARASASMAPLGNMLVLFGGEAKGGVLNDTWTFDGTNWTQASPSTSPPARWSASMAKLGSVLVLFGGFGTSGALDDTWTFDGKNWKQLDVPNHPPAREGASMAYLP